MACSQDGFIEPYRSHRPLHVPDQYQGFFLISLPANPEPAPAPTVASPAKALVSWGHPPAPLSFFFNLFLFAPLFCVCFSCLQGAAWGSRVTHAKVWSRGPGGYTDSFPVPSTLSQLGITGRPVHLWTPTHIPSLNLKVNYSMEPSLEQFLFLSLRSLHIENFL